MELPCPYRPFRLAGAVHVKRPSGSEAVSKMMTAAARHNAVSFTIIMRKARTKEEDGKGKGRRRVMAGERKGIRERGKLRER